MRLLDLFSGIGGFSLAAHWMGWETVAFVEKEKFCQKVLRKNFGQDIDIHDDIFNFSGKPFRGRVDIITGGFPCQPYSQAGLRRGTNDHRHLWPEMLRVIAEVRPRFVVGENVFGIINWSGGMVFEQVLSDLEVEGYEVISFLLPACAVNSPQQRLRVWFVAHSYKMAGESLGIRQGSFISQWATEVRRENWKLFDLVGDGTVFTEWRNEGRNNNSRSIVSRNHNGFSPWVDRFSALGNSIVPQIAYEIFKSIEEAEGMK